MKIRVLVLLFAFLSHGVHAQEQPLPSWFGLSFLVLPEDIAQAAKQGKRVVLYFEQNGCPYCKRMVEVNFADPAIAARMQKRFVPLAINIWGDREVVAPDGAAMTEKQLAARMKVQFTPTLVFFDEKGGIALRINGYYPPDRFLAALDQASTGSAAAGTAMLDRASRPRAVLFQAPRCPACEELEQTLKRDSVAKELAKFQVSRTSLAGPLARQLKVGYAPTLVLFDAEGNEVLRLDAYFRPFHVAGSLEYVASGAYRDEPSLQRFLQVKADRLRQDGAAVDLWN